MVTGIIASSGGAALNEIARITKQKFVVITDRPCGAENVALRHDLECVRIQDPDRSSFSEKAAEVLLSRGCTGVLLFFSRLVSANLFDALPVFNIHPAALPLYPGLHGVADAHRSQVHFLGCTLHRVDASMDGGPIVTQVIRAVDPEWSLERWNRIAFLMKVYCGLVWCSDGHESSHIPTGCAKGIRREWGRSYDLLQHSEQEIGAGFAACSAMEADLFD